MAAKATNDVTKLPRWAQWELEKLRNNLAAAQRELAAMRGEAPAASPVILNTIMQKDVLLPDHASIRFGLPDLPVRYGRDRWVEVSLQNEAVRVYASHYLVIRPAGSNVAILSAGAE